MHARCIALSSHGARLSSGRHPYVDLIMSTLHSGQRPICALPPSGSLLGRRLSTDPVHIGGALQTSGYSLTGWTLFVADCCSSAGCFGTSIHRAISRDSPKPQRRVGFGISRICQPTPRPTGFAVTSPTASRCFRAFALASPPARSSSADARSARPRSRGFPNLSRLCAPRFPRVARGGRNRAPELQR